VVRKVHNRPLPHGQTLKHRSPGRPAQLRLGISHRHI
jgi:hypothetical protein